VVIAAFNAERTLGAQLDALSRQAVTFHWEVLVCDNGSTDATADLVRSWVGKGIDVVLVDASARRGPAAARNEGARRARAALLAFCDADDVVADDWVASMHAALQHDDLVAGVSTRQVLGAPRDDPQYYEFGPYRIERFPYLLAAAANNLGVRRSAFESVGGFDESLRTGEDDDFCWRVQLAGHPLATHPEITIRAGSREGLPAIFAQAFAYGRGDRQLLHKYRRVIAAFESGHSAFRIRIPVDTSLIDSRVESVATESVGRLGRRLRRLARLRHASELGDVVHRLGIVAGFRFGRIDRAAPQLDPDRVLGGTLA
jgi:glycosyltransferase involved in cell wall biosynthesis